VEQPIPFAVKTVLSLISHAPLLPVASLSPETVSLVPFNFQFPSSYSHQLWGLEGRNGNPTPTIKISKPRLTCNHLKQTELQNTGSHPGRPGHGSTRWVDRVLPGHCTSRSFDKPGLVLPPERLVFGSTYFQVDLPGRSEFNNYGLFPLSIFFFLNINITLIWFLMLIKNSPGPLAAWELFHGLG